MTKISGELKYKCMVYLKCVIGLTKVSVITKIDGKLGNIIKMFSITKINTV